MSIITISRGSYSRGKEVAERVSEALQYECISRDILIEASEQFNTPEFKLIRAIHDAPSVLERFTYGKEKYVAYIRAALLKHVQKDNVVYHGIAGHYFLRSIPHVMKVRIIANMEDRVLEETKRENISAEEARLILAKDDGERRKWGYHLYGIDTSDPGLYDLVLHIDTLSVADATDIILHSVQRPCFRTSSASQTILDDLVLSAQIQALLVEEEPTVKVSAKNGTVLVYFRAPLSRRKKIEPRIEKMVGQIPGVKEVRISVEPIVTDYA
ncbi:MAG: cytidylate kinase-like family protein [Desulfobacteraceae bacterium]|nr:MAG: cytidylate kinase-like family protein [Desulfobacteraceae bacterium]